MVAEDSSLLYARNLYNFVVPMMAKDGSGLAVNWDDEIIKGTCLTRDGKVVHPALLPEEEKAPEPVAAEAAAQDSGASETETPGKGA